MSAASSRLARTFARREAGVALILGLTVLIVSLVNPAFLSAANARDILVNASPFAIVGCGLTFVIITGEIDISVGSLAGLLAASLGLSLTQRIGLGVPAGISLTLALGAAAGLVNGLLITLARVPSIIVTLATLTAFRGLTDLLMGGEWIPLPAQLRFLGTGSVVGIPVSILVAAIVCLLSAALAIHTPFGRRIYAAGSNPHAAVLSGVSPQRIKLACFALTGLLTAIATLVSVPQLSLVENGFGVGWEMFVITAVVIGGTSISGGKGTILGTVLGVILLSIIRNALIFLKLGLGATYWERAIQGGFILAAVLVDQLGRRRSEDE